MIGPVVAARRAATAAAGVMRSAGRKSATKCGDRRGGDHAAGRAERFGRHSAEPGELASDRCGEKDRDDQAEKVGVAFMRQGQVKNAEEGDDAAGRKLEAARQDQSGGEEEDDLKCPELAEIDRAPFANNAERAAEPEDAASDQHRLRPIGRDRGGGHGQNPEAEPDEGGAQAVVARRREDRVKTGGAGN
jgi:hypothetical protein